MRWVILSPALFLLALVGDSVQSAEPTPAISWKKTTLDKKFRSEGVAVADVNRDGKLDILTGELWYEAPDWTPHELQKPGNYGDGLGGYSHVFACWADDINGDGWADLIVVDFPGDPCYWLENPKGKPGHWKRHTIWHSACNETPIYVDLFGKGKRVLVMAFQPKDKRSDGNEGQMAWFGPGKDPEALWTMHPISEPTTTGKTIPGTMRYAHGLGIGDLNNDGRADVMCNGGWWEQPTEDAGTPWKFHPANLGPDCADMFAIDVDGDGKNDVVSSSAHKFGIWAHLQKPGKGGDPTFVKTDLFKDLVSETHAMHYVDIDGDGLKDLVTGKRYWSHGRSEPGSDKPAAIYWFQCSKAKDGVLTFTPHVIDEDSGIGTQFQVIDIDKDGLLDIVVSNKKGVHVIVQQRGPAPKVSARIETREIPAKVLFDGKSLTGWDTYLGKPEKGTPDLDPTKPLGLNNDPLKVYTVVETDGKPAIRISGQVFGAITSKDEFENYHLKFEVKWGEKRWPPRERAIRDSGLLYHCVGPHGAGSGFWMKSFESQIQENDFGDFYGVAGVIVDVEGERENDKGAIVFKTGGRTFRGVTDRIVRNPLSEKKLGEWNTVELYCYGGTSVHVNNGKVNMVMTNLRHKVEGKEVPLTKGRIQLQSEGAEVFYRNIEVRSIDGLPKDLLK